MAGDYPVDLRADYPERSSRGWAALTILIIKLLAVIPHGIVLMFLGIGQWVVAFIAQIAVALGREYPRGMFDFVAGVLRWQTRVTAFVLSLTDRYPPFTLRPGGEYPVDVVVERPAQHSRMYAVFTVVVQVLFIAGLIWFLVELARGADWAASLVPDATDPSGNTSSPASYSSNWGGWSGLALRQIAAIPHLIVLFFLGIAAFVVWVIVQWVILFVARYPRGMFDFSAGVVRWQTRVSAYGLGLIDRYPPFTFEPSVGGTRPQPAEPAAPPLPPAPAAPLRQPADTAAIPAPQQASAPPAPEGTQPLPPAPEPPAPPSPPAP